MINSKTRKLLLFSFLCLSVIVIMCQKVYAGAVITDADVSASSYVAPYSPDRAVNTSSNSNITASARRWYCSDPDEKWIQLDFKQVRYIESWYVSHLGNAGWDPSCNTSNYRLESSMDGNSWTVRDSVVGNTANATDRTVTPFVARYVRLLITQGNQKNNNWASIMDFWVYAAAPDGTLESKPSDKTYKAGETLNFTVKYPVPVTVNTAGGTPSIPITLDSGVVDAVYSGGSGTSVLNFSYIVKTGDWDANRITLGPDISYNGGYIADTLGNNAKVTLKGIGDTSGILVDAVPKPGTLQFDPVSVTINENAGPATLTITRTNGADETVTADYAVTGGTAEGEGIDFLLEPGTVTFNEGETSKSITVNITDDEIYEGDETIIITLSNPTGGATLGNNAATVTILENDPIPYTVSIGALEGGSITASPSTTAAGATVSLTITPDSGKRLKEGTLKYTDGLADYYITGTSFTMPAANLTVTAEFEDILYTVTFNKNNGDTEASPAAIQVISGGSTGTLPVSPVRSGYLFTGWNTAPDGSGTSFTADTAVSADLTVYAQWTLNTTGSGSSSPAPATPEKPAVSENKANTANVIINNEELAAGNESKTEEDGKSVVVVEVNDKVIESKIDETANNNVDGTGNFLQVSVTDAESEEARVGLNGDIVRKLEDNSFDISVKKDNVEYIIPAEEIAIGEAAANLGVPDDELENIRVEIRITKLDNDVVEKYEAIVKADGAELIFPPVKFEVAVKITDPDGNLKEAEISRFSSYVERVMEIPEGVDPGKVTTGIVFNPDGTYSHVPTEVYQKDGKWYARVKSLTNSVYSLIWNPVTVKSVENHWAKEAVNDLASRLIISDPENFNPYYAISRADFAEYIVRALGIYREGTRYENKFIDVDGSDERTLAILTASEYGIVTGYTDGDFRPQPAIAREEAMIMLQRAMKLTKLTGKDVDRYKSYTDFSDVSSWAADSVKEVLAAHVFNGISDTKLSPKSTLTYAEAAQAIRNLLVESKLISN